MVNTVFVEPRTAFKKDSSSNLSTFSVWHPVMLKAMIGKHIRKELDKNEWVVVLLYEI